MTDIFVYEARFRPELLATLRELSRRIASGKVASFMVDEDAAGHVHVFVIPEPFASADEERVTPADAISA